MKKQHFYFQINLASAIVLCAMAAHAVAVPPQIFSINQAIVGVTTLDEVQKTYGMAYPTKVSEDDGADITICYVHSSLQGKSFLVFESGAMGGWEDLTGFRLSISPPNGNCVSTEFDIGTLATGNGVRLGQSLEEFLKTVPVEFNYHGSELTYQAVGQRPATPEELKYLRTNWPNAEQDFFDVTTNIKAKFQDNLLIDFYVHKIESY